MMERGQVDGAAAGSEGWASEFQMTIVLIPPHNRVEYCVYSRHILSHPYTPFSLSLSLARALFLALFLILTVSSTHLLFAYSTSSPI